MVRHDQNINIIYKTYCNDLISLTYNALIVHIVRQWKIILLRLAKQLLKEETSYRIIKSIFAVQWISFTVIWKDHYIIPWSHWQIIVSCSLVQNLSFVILQNYLHYKYRSNFMSMHEESHTKTHIQTHILVHILAT